MATQSRPALAKPLPSPSTAGSEGRRAAGLTTAPWECTSSPTREAGSRVMRAQFSPKPTKPGIHLWIRGIILVQGPAEETP